MPNSLDLRFDDLLLQTQKYKLSHEEIIAGRRIDEFQQLNSWRLKYGYKLNIYSNDHLINGKPHFHFDNDEKNVHCKMSFDGDILNSTANSIPPNVFKDLLFFLKIQEHSKTIRMMWNEKNPSLLVPV